MFPTSEWLGPRGLGIQPNLGSNLTSHGFEYLIYLMGIVIIPYELLHDSNEMSKQNSQFIVLPLNGSSYYSGMSSQLLVSF